MIKHYLKVFVRNLVKNRTYSIIDIFGLATGIAVCLLITLYVRDELSAAKYISRIMQGTTPFPDYPEKNDRWQTGKRLFLASTLSLIEPVHPILNVDRELWHEIARRTFESGKYNADAEIKAHQELTGASVKGRYLVLSSRYQLNILGLIPGMITIDLEEALLQWLIERPEGIGYLNVPLNQPPPPRASVIHRWLTSWEM